LQPDVASDWDWTRQFLPEIRARLGSVLITEASFQDDAKRATDLIVLGFDSVRIACRIRRPKYLSAYGHQFTIRTDRTRTNAKTELAKIIEGWGDYFFYGFGGADGHLASWLIGDLHVFRGWFVRECVRRSQGSMPGTLQHNNDGTEFRAFDTDALPPEFVLARQRYQGIKAA